mgnify:CR=1 FL=1
MAATSNTARSGFALVEAAVVLTIIGILVAVLLPAIEAARPYRPPTIPDREPGEAYRVHLPSGFSVVRPPYWEVTSAEDPNGSWGQFEFRSPIANKPGGYLRIFWERSEPARDPKAVEIKFQGRPAWMTTERQNPVFMDYAGKFTAFIQAPRDDCWISISYSFFGDQSAVPDMMWKYFETVAASSNAATATAENREGPSCP